MDAVTSANIEVLAIDQLKPSRNARTHSDKQVAQIARSIQHFGFVNPVLIADDGAIIAGHGRVMAAKMLRLREVPCLRLSHLSEAERRAYILADNRLAEQAGWDKEILALEFQGLLDLNFDVELTGFESPEIDLILNEVGESSTGGPLSPDDDIPEVPSPLDAVSRQGDLWQLSRHRLLCGDARSEASYRSLMHGEQAAMVFTDPPYNVPIDGHASGLGRTKHRDFACAIGEMSEEEFTTFLKQSLGHAAKACCDGAIAYVCSDWRHVGEMRAAGLSVFSEMKNICVWVKTNGGMGTFYRSKHEFVFVWKIGKAPHVNTFGLGDKGRYRTNVWTYAGVNTFKAERTSELESHPTVKPVALVSDAIRDVSHRGHIVLDPFGGSGTTLIAAHRTGRTARLIEIDPAYCDVIIRRFEHLTGKQAILSSRGQTFERVGQIRNGTWSTVSPDARS